MTFSELNIESNEQEYFKNLVEIQVETIEEDRK